MEILRKFSLLTIGGISDTDALLVLTATGVLPKEELAPFCPACGEKMRASVDKQKKIGWIWLCSNRNKTNCSKSVNPVNNTFFQNVKLSFRHVLILMMHFVFKVPSSTTNIVIEEHCSALGEPTLSSRTIEDMYSFFREIAEVHASHIGGNQLGGKGKAPQYYHRTRLDKYEYARDKLFEFLKDTAKVYPGYGVEGLKLKVIDSPTVDSEDNGHLIKRQA